MMKNGFKHILYTALFLGLCVGLCACDAIPEDDTLFDNNADYSVSIELPYATNVPKQDASEASEALVIDYEGNVTVNDSETVLSTDTEQISAGNNYKTLRSGHTGIAVQALQKRLKELGYYLADVNGIYDDATETAVRRFEQSYGTMQTGVASVDMQARLFASDAPVYASAEYNAAVLAQYSPLTLGDAGSSVRALQQRLMNLGYPNVTQTGIYDNDTARAVELFFAEYGIESGANTATTDMQRELYSDSAKSYSGTDVEKASNAATLKKIQKRLAELGYLSDTDDTVPAVKLFEVACGQMASGDMSEAVQEILFSDTAPSFEYSYGGYVNLMEGSSGEAVSRLQARLLELGYAQGEADGEYAAATTSAVRLFQNTNGLKETGVATKFVQAVMFSNFALNVDGETLQTLVSESVETTEVEVAEVEIIEAESETIDEDALRVGSVGAEVRDLQYRLADLGYTVSQSGEYDEATAQAVGAMQQQLGVNVTLTADSSFLRFIMTDAAPAYGTDYAKGEKYSDLEFGAEGETVKKLQKRLVLLGYLSEDDATNGDGMFGTAMLRALHSVQDRLGYTEPEGLFSAELISYLLSEYSIEIMASGNE